jgi:hypothetical protein
LQRKQRLRKSAEFWHRCCSISLQQKFFALQQLIRSSAKEKDMEVDYVKMLCENNRFKALITEMTDIFQVDRKEATLLALSMLIREFILAAEMAGAVA